MCAWTPWKWVEQQSTLNKLSTKQDIPRHYPCRVRFEILCGYPNRQTPDEDQRTQRYDNNKDKDNRK